MNWLTAYLVAGACVAALSYLMHATHWTARLGRRLQAIALDPKPKPSFGRRVLEDGLVPLLAVLAILVAWPLVLVLLLRELPERWRHWRNRERPFRIRRRDLRYAFTQAEVEARECVHDPLGAVPPLPFGHLNPAWRRYADALEPRARLRAFSVLMNPRSWKPVRHEGYVVVDRWGRVGAHFVAGRCVLGRP